MNTNVSTVVTACSQGSEDNTLTFPQQLARLAEVDVEGYYADLRRGTKTYYLPSGESVEVACRRMAVPIPDDFDASRVESAVRQSQAGAHSYRDFCEKVMAAGCCGYLVSLLGRRVVYFGRSADTHVEHFPAAN